MSLIPNEKISRAKDEWSVRCARRLRHIATDKMKRLRSYKETSWAKEFARLRASLDGNEHLIEQTLDWYENNWERVIAKPACAGSWCRDNLFNLMVSMMEQDRLAHNHKGAPDQSHDKTCTTRLCVKTTPTDDVIAYLTDNGIDVEDTVEQVRELGFPKAGARGLPDAVALSCQAIVKTSRRLAAMSEDGSLDDYGILADIAGRVLDRIGHDYQEATVRWFRSYLPRLKRWREWNGSWKPFLFAWDNKEFVQIIDQCCDSTRQADEFFRAFRDYTPRRK